MTGYTVLAWAEFAGRTRSQGVLSSSAQQVRAATAWSSRDLPLQLPNWSDDGFFVLLCFH